MKEFNKKNPFKTPENYFEGFYDRVKNTLSNENANIPKEDGFVVPNNYFESLHDKIREKTDTDRTQVLRLNSYKKYYYAVASIAAVVLITFGVIFNISESPKFDDLAYSDIEAYFEVNELGLTSYEIAEVIPIDELEINDILKDQLHDENIINYLNENINDFDELNLENYE